jgi:hypothetical protein
MATSSGDASVRTKTPRNTDTGCAAWAFLKGVVLKRYQVKMRGIVVIAAIIGNRRVLVRRIGLP